MNEVDKILKASGHLLESWGLKDGDESIDEATPDGREVWNKVFPEGSRQERAKLRSTYLELGDKVYATESDLAPLVKVDKDLARALQQFMKAKQVLDKAMDKYPWD